jgi:hypothetical protein
VAVQAILLTTMILARTAKNNSNGRIARKALHKCEENCYNVETSKLARKDMATLKEERSELVHFARQL